MTTAPHIRRTVRRMGGRLVGVIAACALAGVAAVGCGSPAAGSDPLRSTTSSTAADLAPITTPTTTAEPSTPAVPATTAEPATTVTTAPADPIEAMLQGLYVEPEHLEGYDRDLFEHWIDADGDGCRTRCEVLEAERRTDLPELASGWFSIYDGFTTDDPTKIEIDHVVALAEAWRSGAWSWDAARREAFANDLDEPGALIAVSSKSNQSKADKDPGEWRPTRRESWCEWATSWLAVKAKWQLSVDDRELQALRQVLADC